MLRNSQKHEKLLEKACAQRIKLLDKLQAANKEITLLQKQLANGKASVASIANVANYRPCRIGPKKQLTGTNFSAFASWKCTVNNKFCVAAVIFLTEKNKISYAFYQFNQPIF